MQPNTPLQVVLTQQDFEALFTWITSYQEWIEDIINENGLDDLTPT